MSANLENSGAALVLGSGGARAAYDDLRALFVPAAAPARAEVRRSP
jgi:hypothetical protein